MFLVFYYNGLSVYFNFNGGDLETYLFIFLSRLNLSCIFANGSGKYGTIFGFSMVSLKLLNRFSFLYCKHSIKTADFFTIFYFALRLGNFIHSAELKFTKRFEFVEFAGQSVDNALIDVHVYVHLISIYLIAGLQVAKH